MTSTPFLCVLLSAIFLCFCSTVIAAPANSHSNQEQYLSAHNQIRASHGASPLSWSTTLADAAKNWASQCNFASSGVAYGENMAAGAGSFSVRAFVQTLNADSSDYDPANPTYNHFTQIVWKQTTELGCAVASCRGIIDQSYGKATFHVCFYNPAGNIIGQAPSNVQA